MHRRLLAILALLATSATALRVPNPPQMRAPGKASTRRRVPPPPPGSPKPADTVKRWATVQASADAVSVSVVSLLAQKTPIELYYEQSVLLWVLLGPALVTFGAVWARITQTTEIPDFETDFFVQKLGGANAVRALRYEISEALRF